MLKVIRDAALLRIGNTPDVNSNWAMSNIELLLEKPGFGRILLRHKDIAAIVNVSPPVFCKFPSKPTKIFLPGHFEFELLKLSVCVDVLSWDPLCLLSEDQIRNLPMPAAKLTKIYDLYGFSRSASAAGGGGGGGGAAASTLQPISFKSTDPLLKGFGASMEAFLATYANRCAQSGLSRATQCDLCEIFGRIACGNEASDVDAAVTLMPIGFERPLVPSKGEARM